MKRFLKGFLCGMLTTSMMLVVALTVGQFSGYIDLGAAWNRTDQDSTMKREVKQKAVAGDIILYDGHVGIYMGNGQIVNAINSAKGIGILPATYTNIVTVRRLV